MRHDFGFDPLHYGAGGAQQRLFKERVASELRSYDFLFTGEVGILWHIYVDEQDRWETPNGADVDNFAKLLNDAIKGADALLFDDCQIQRLEIAWLPARGERSFELTVRCQPDEWVTRPASLYELSDGLWYPFSSDEANALKATGFLHGLDDNVRLVKKLRHHLRQGGLTKLEAFESAKPIESMARGFHRTRIADGGFGLISHSEWMADHNNPERAVGDIDEIARKLSAAIITARHHRKQLK